MEAFLTNLKKYNEGAFVLDCGRWYDPSVTDWRDVMKEIGCMNEDGETVAEWFISDYDDCPLDLGENPNLDALEDLAHVCDKYGPDLVEAVYNYRGDIESTIDTIECGDFLLIEADDEEDLGYWAVDNDYFKADVPEEIKCYLDYEAIGRDCAINSTGGFVTIDYVGYYLKLL